VWPHCSISALLPTRLSGSHDVGADAQFRISAKDLGNLSAFYFYTYVAMQIPTGVLVDSWGARKLLIAGSISAAAGTFLFGATDNFALACLEGRS